MNTAAIALNSAPTQLGDFLAERLNGRAAPQPQQSEAIEFLSRLDPEGRHNLVAIDPTGKCPVEGQTFDLRDWPSIARWIQHREGRLNLYFSVNEPKTAAPNKKLTDSDIAKIRCICADVDPARGADLASERERLRTLADGLRSGAVPPAVIDSGGGFQFFWRLGEKLDPVRSGSEVRAQGRGIAQALGGDAVYDLARIMRLPGTTNIPDAKKAARGRTRTMAKMVAATDRTYSLEELGQTYAPTVATSVADNDDQIDEIRRSLDMRSIRATSKLSDLDEAVRIRFEKILTSDDRARRLWDGDASVLGKDKSGSAFRGALADLLGRAGGFSAQSYGEILHSWDHAVTGHGDIEEIVSDRSIARDWVRVGLRLSPERWLEPISEKTEEIGTTPLRSWTMVSAQDAARDALKECGKPLVKGLLDVGALSVLYGDSNVGKTFVAMDIAIHVGAGLQWGGMRTTKSAVLYVAAEGGAAVGKRCRALREKLGSAFDTAAFSLHPESVDLLHANADLQPLIAAVKAAPEGIGLVVIDTLSRAMAGGDENASTDMGALVRNLDAIRLQTGAHVLVVHHSGKDKARGARGHSLLRAATDTEIEISENQITVTKQRDLDKSFSRAFELKPVVLGKDADGDPVTSCIVRLIDRIEAPVAPPTATEQVILDALTSILSTMPDDIQSVRTTDIVEYLANAGTPKDGGSLRTFLRRLAEKGQVRSPKQGFWAPKNACRAGLHSMIQPELEIEPTATSDIRPRQNLFE